MEQLFRKYYKELIYFGLKFITSRDIVEDIVADVFIDLRKNKYENIPHARRSLYLCVKNKCIDHLRAYKRRRSSDLYMEEAESIEAEIVEIELLKHIEPDLIKCINNLPGKSKTVIDMYYLQGLNCVQIGQELNQSEATIRSVKRYALGLLKNMILHH